MCISRLPALLPTALLLTALLLMECPSLPASAAHAAAAAAPAQPQTEANPTADLIYERLQEQLEDYVGRQQGTYGVYVIDITSGKVAGVNHDMPFPAASTIKLPMAMYTLHLVDRGQLSLDEQITYVPELDYQEGTGALHASLRNGERVRVRRLVELAIIYSDNIAANMLMRRIGPENVFDFMRALGGKVTKYVDNTPSTTPRDMAMYMRLAACSKAIAGPELRKWLLDLLSNTTFKDRMAAGVPAGVQVAHKIGSLPGIVNDVALIYAPNRPFVIAVFSMNVNNAVAADVIAEITRHVYTVHAGWRGPSRSRRDRAPACTRRA